MKRGQVSVISVVIIAFLVVSLVGGSYMFARPMIEKQGTLSQHASAAKFMADVDNAIVDIARSCVTEGGCEEKRTIPVDGSLVLDEGSNSLVYTVYSQQPLITEGKVILTPGNTDEVAEYGEVQNPGYILMEGISTGGQNMVKYTLHYRSLYNEDQGKTYNITLEPAGSGREQGANTLMLNYGGTTTQVGTGPYSSDYVNSKVMVKIL